MTIPRAVVAMACAFSIGPFAVDVSAAPVFSLADFLAIAPGPVGTLDFEAIGPGTDLSGTTQSVTGGLGTGIEFPAISFDFQGFPTRFQVTQNIAGSNPTTSGRNSLGTDDSGNFNLISAGTSFSLQMSAPVNAFGMSFITPDELFDEDIRFSTLSATASLMAGQRWVVDVVDGTTYYAYFLGLVSGESFTQVNVDYGPAVSGVPFLYNIDDIRVATAPEPASLVLTLLALCGAASCSLRRRQSSVHG